MNSGTNLRAFGLRGQGFLGRSFRLKAIAISLLALSSQLSVIESSEAATITYLPTVNCEPTRSGGGSVTMQVGDILVINTTKCLSGGYGGPNSGTWKSGRDTGEEVGAAATSGGQGTNEGVPAGNGRINFLDGYKVTFRATAVGTGIGITFSQRDNTTDNVSPLTSPEIRITVNAADTTAPTLSSSTPTDNATNVAVNDNIALTFNESVQAGTGSILLNKTSDNTTVATISITDGAQITISGSTVTINPTSNLDSNTGYYVQIASGVIKDLANNAFAGITIASTLNFTTAAAAPNAPTLNSVTAGDRRVTVAFTAGANNGAAITDYEYSLNGGTYTSAGTTTSPFTITGLSGRTSYSVTLKAINSVGLSAASNSISATTSDAALDASETAAETARVAAAAQAARLAREQQELINILTLIPKLGELSLSLGETTKSLYSTKCVKGKTTKFVKKGAKCPKGLVRKR
jgi:methionine-rich copper-binding protein CopC